jgi:hypothetical protein
MGREDEERLNGRMETEFLEMEFKKQSGPLQAESAWEHKGNTLTIPSPRWKT